MDNFEDIDFDSIEGVTKEIHDLTRRLLGIMDYVDDPNMNDLPYAAQRRAHHLGQALEEANNKLLDGLDSWLNGMWHDLSEDEKVDLLED